MTESSTHEPLKPPAHRGGRLAFVDTSHRFGAFTDAAVAIALTLLALPLLEGVVEASAEHLTTLEYLSERRAELIGFVISFLVIGVFWLQHHRIFRADTPMSPARSLVNLAWLLTIAWLPVATALDTGLPGDAAQTLVYIGSMALSSWLLFVLAVLEYAARARAGLPNPDRSILAAPLAMSILYTLAALIGALTGTGALALFLLALTWPLRGLLVRLGLRSRPTE
ncbi:TMEM175 family protein [Naumannella cuiyingiana]|uniref:Putative membrane protein n=1 Tax=Naumannella cuiyingiana TaxID=1347891 RepID=A0A7Z0D885_9ACTN|nr:TMEM175 family protein [Naumannella cuiyingiana]NYI70569.1 putative membrane protein [Naumannella cuiyingiana]